MPAFHPCQGGTATADPVPERPFRPLSRRSGEPWFVLRGDLILVKLAKTLIIVGRNTVNCGNGLYSIFALSLTVIVGFIFSAYSSMTNVSGLVVGEIVARKVTPSENFFREVSSNCENVGLAQAIADGVKVNGIDTYKADLKDNWLEKDIVKAVKKRLQHKSPKVQLFALNLLKIMVKNYGEYIHLQIAERNVLQEMVKVAWNFNVSGIEDLIELRHMSTHLHDNYKRSSPSQHNLTLLVMRH